MKKGIKKISFAVDVDIIYIYIKEKIKMKKGIKNKKNVERINYFSSCLITKFAWRTNH
jgi:hypothetical protein